VPLHLGVTEAGMPPDGIIKTRIAFEQLIGRGIGDTIRVSLTLPNDRKPEEIDAGRQIVADIAAGRVRSVVDFGELTRSTSSVARVVPGSRTRRSSSWPRASRR
jgi:(E)-4-hydroxy-3-methylbut-2-enyl-diphosphate synthase